MKKIVSLTLMALVVSINCFSQSQKDSSKKIKECSECVNTGECPPPESVFLCYDTCTRKIILKSKDGLDGKKTYVFKICNVNSAIFSAKISASNITRAAALPPILSSLGGNLSAPKIENTKSLNFKEHKDTSNSIFFLRYKYDYDFLRLLSADTKDLILLATNNPTNTSLLKDSAINKIKFLQQQGLPIATYLDIDLKAVKSGKASENNGEGESLRFNDINPSSEKGDESLKSFVIKVLSDFSTRAAIINSDHKVSDGLSLEQFTQVKRAYLLVKADSLFLIKCPDIINSIKNSNCCIVSSPYQITADYLQLNIALLKNKFTDKPDTVSTNKFNFYRIHYWKWIDVSAGIFYDNLASKSYYFKNTIPTQEIKSSTDFSVGALIHSYWVFCSAFKAGPAVGIATSVLDGKSKYLAGASILIGKNNEFAFSGGLAWASLPQISNLYGSNTITTTTTTSETTSGSSQSSVDGGAATITTTSGNSNKQDTVTSPIGTTGAVSTYNKFQRGIFFSITYSFLKL